MWSIALPISTGTCLEGQQERRHSGPKIRRCGERDVAYEAQGQIEQRIDVRSKF